MHQADTQGGSTATIKAPKMPEQGTQVTVTIPYSDVTITQSCHVEWVYTDGGDVDLRVLADDYDRSDVGSVWTMTVGQVARGDVTWEAA